MAKRKKTVRNSFWFKKRGIERRGRKRPVAFQSSGKGPDRTDRKDRKTGEEFQNPLRNAQQHIKVYPFMRNTPLDPLNRVRGAMVQEYMDRHQRTKAQIVEDPRTLKEISLDPCPPQIRVALRTYWESNFHHGFDQWHRVDLYDRSDGNLWFKLWFAGNRFIFVRFRYGVLHRSKEYHNHDEAWSAWRSQAQGRGIYWLKDPIVQEGG